MTITEKLRRAFPGVSSLVTAIIDALRAYQEYEKALNAMEALKIRDPVNAWIWDVTRHSMLSYSEALSIYEYLSEFSVEFKQTPKDITEFVIETANCGRTSDTIIRHLKQIDMELNKK